MGGTFSVLEDIGDFIWFLIVQLIDFVFGGLAIIWSIARQAATSIPLIFDIIEYLLDLIDYAIDLFREYWGIGVVAFMLTPMYFMLYFLINRINAIL